MLLSQFKLLDLTQYPGRRRTYVENTDAVFSNQDNTILTEDFVIESSSLQPISGFTLQAVPEGYRSKAQYTFWTVTEIRPLIQGSNQLSDQINIDGKWYSIYALSDWTRTSFLQHTQCIAIYDDQDNSWHEDVEGGNFG